MRHNVNLAVIICPPLCNIAQIHCHVEIHVIFQWTHFSYRTAENMKCLRIVDISLPPNWMLWERSIVELCFVGLMGDFTSKPTFVCCHEFRNMRLFVAKQ